MNRILMCLALLAPLTASAKSGSDPSEVLVRSFSAQTIEVLTQGHLPAPKLCRLSLWQKHAADNKTYFVLRFENGLLAQPNDIVTTSGNKLPNLQASAEGNSFFNHETLYNGTTLVDQYVSVVSESAPNFDQKMTSQFILTVDPDLSNPLSLDLVETSQSVVRSPQFPLAAVPVYFPKTVSEVRCSNFTTTQP